MIREGEGKGERVWREITFRKFGNVSGAIPPWPCENRYLHCLGRDLLEPPLRSWITLISASGSNSCLLGGGRGGGWGSYWEDNIHSGEERIAGGRAL